MEVLEVPPDVVDVDETELLVAVVLRYVDVEVVVAILLQPAYLSPWSDITRHLIREDGRRVATVLLYDPRQGGVLPVWNVVEHHHLTHSAEHTQHTVDSAGKHRASAQFLSAKSRLIDLNRSIQPDEWQNPTLDEQAACFSDQLEVLGDLASITHQRLSQSGPHVVYPEEYAHIEHLDVQVTERRRVGDASSGSTSAATPD